MDNRSKYEYILSNTYNLLRFAETKNGVLLTLLLGLTFFVNDNNWFLGGQLVVVNILFGIPVVILLQSFFPRFDKKVFFKDDYEKVNKRDFNVLSIQDLSIVPDELMSKNELDNYIANYENALQRQIGINSRIAMNKFRSFSIAIVFSSVALVVFILLML